MKKALVLANATARGAAADYCYSVPDGTICEFRPPKKSRDQEMKYHAIINEIAASHRHLNRALDAETWKRLLVDQFRRDTQDDGEIGEYWRQHPIEFIPALDGSGLVILGDQTRDFPKVVAMAFIDWLEAWRRE
jgi:hypothetical protein